MSNWDDKGAVSMGSPRRTIARWLVIAAAIWAAVNGPVEGPTLLVVTHGNGLTVADLPSIAAVIVAAWLRLPPAGLRTMQARRKQRQQPHGTRERDGPA